MEKLKSDYKVTKMNGQKKIIPYQRIHIFIPVHLDVDGKLEGFSDKEMVLAKRLENVVLHMNGTYL